MAVIEAIRRTRGGRGWFTPAPPAAVERLRARNISVAFGAVTALEDVEVAVDRGEILGLIGPNGAGKTTLVNVLSGFQRVPGAEILLDDRSIGELGVAQRAAHGLVRTFQAGRLFHGLSVYENLAIATAAARMPRAAGAALVDELIARFRMGGCARLAAGSLAFGDERRLSIARALAARPAFLLLDEPAAGLNERESDELLHMLQSIREDFAIGLLIVEHDMRLIMRLCDRVQVLNYGRTLAIGTPSEIGADPAVIDAYLGTEAADDA